MRACEDRLFRAGRRCPVKVPVCPVIAAVLAILAVALLAAPQLLPSSQAIPPDPDLLYQVSPIDALMRGAYDGVIPVGELMRHGDFGLGTFEGLDGEMVVLDGICYRAGVDGVAHPVEGGVMVPLAAVTTFERERVVPGISGKNITQVTAALDAALPSKNLFAAIRIDGTFPAVKARSEPRQEKPYQPLPEVLATQQAVFLWHNVTGTVVGFYTPPFAKGIGVTGYHLHFLSADRMTGGHILDLEVDDTPVVLDITPRFTVVLPESGDFTGMDLSGDLSKELAEVEQ
ncbi:MAG: acetolactate decarboxylase [Methanomicrobiales archaeon]|nr:acetolactate decarboxylase [Methanomicrobiales archaeon]